MREKWVNLVWSSETETLLLFFKTHTHKFFCFGKVFPLCDWPHPCARAWAWPFKASTSMVVHGALDVWFREIRGTVVNHFLKYPILHAFFMLKFLWKIVRTLGNSQGEIQHPYIKISKKRRNSPSYSGWECNPRHAHRRLPPFPYVSQLPVILLWEFLLTQSQLNIEINGAIHGGKGNDSKFLELLTSDHRQKSLILELSYRKMPLPKIFPEEWGILVLKAEVHLGHLMLLEIFINTCSKCLETFGLGLIYKLDKCEKTIVYSIKVSGH